MNSPRYVFLLLALHLASVSLAAEENAALRHFTFFDRDRERLTERAFLTNHALAGAQVKYTWRELETRKGTYNFTPITEDIQLLHRHGKQLFIQLQDVSFDEQIVNVPDYLLQDPEFNGGANRQFSFEREGDANPKPAGWVARRWDAAVQARWQALVNALGKEFDGKIEGINLPETSVDFGESGRWYPPGFTPEGYRDAVVTNMAALKKAFPKSIAMQYANFMPGEWLPENDRSLLRDVYKKASELGVGLGGPDLLPYRRGQMNHGYPLLRETSGRVPTGIAVQWGNYESKNPKTERVVTVPELMEFAREYLKVSHIFWCMQEPYYSEKVIPYLLQEKR